MGPTSQRLGPHRWCSPLQGNSSGCSTAPPPANSDLFSNPSMKTAANTGPWTREELKVLAGLNSPFEFRPSR